MAQQGGNDGVETVLLAAIEAAFTDVPKGAITIHEADLLYNLGISQTERDAARARDRDSRWQEIPDSTIRKCSHALPFLDQIGWRYYVPAYMSWSIRHVADRESDSVDSTIYTFSHFDDAGYARYQSLSASQLTVVRRFLQFMADHPGQADDEVARDSLEKYWSRF